MADYEREQEIIKFLKSNKRVTVSQLAELLCVSDATVRRELTELEFKRLIRRTHGGAVLCDDGQETSTIVRETNNAKEKYEVAKMAANRLPPYYSLFLDNSSTGLALIKTLDIDNKMIVTNGMQAINYIANETKALVYIPGGQVKMDIGGITGSKPVDDLQNYRFDLVIVSCSAVDEFGVYEPNEQASAIKKAALKRGKFKVLLFDNSKVNAKGSFKSCELNDFDLVVTNATRSEIKKLLDVKSDIKCKE